MTVKRRKLKLLWTVSSYIFLCTLSFHAGTIHGFHSCVAVVSSPGPGERWKETSREWNTQQLSKGTRDLQFAKVPASDFRKTFDTGVPWNDDSVDHVWIWNQLRQQPSNIKNSTVEDAVEGCNVVRILPVGSLQPTERTCFALVDYESYHTPKFVVENNKKEWQPASRHQVPERPHVAADRQTLLSSPPKAVATKQALSELSRYISTLDDLLRDLKPFAEQVATKSNTIVVMVVNQGHLELLRNYMCTCLRVGVDMSNILVISLDEPTHRAVTELGLTTFYHPIVQNNQNAATYGTREYAQIMMAKVYAVHWISLLGYDVLFHDVDIVPYHRNYLDYFIQQSSDYDIVFQYDGGHDYLPWSANSGFYFVRNNVRTKYLWSLLARMGDTILRTKSHQATLTELLSEQSNLYGLRVKTLWEEHWNYPTGYLFHQNRTYMQEVLRGERAIKAMHMNYNDNFETKQKFLEQMGDWYVDENGSCRNEAVPKCHFRDKPSKLPCRDSPMIESQIPFWD